MRWLSLGLGLGRSGSDAARGDGASARSRGPRRPRAVPWWRGRLARRGGALLLIAGVGGGGFAAWQEGLLARLLDGAGGVLVAATAEIGFRVEEVFVVGRRETTRGELNDALGVGRGDPILFIDIVAARERVQALPWVTSAAVERRLPDILVVRVIERRPLALWQHHGTFALIDGDGTMIRRDDLDRFAGLLRVVGDGAPAHTASLVAMLNSEPELRDRVVAAVRVGDRRWNLRLTDGVDVLLPEDDPAAAWSRLAGYQRDHGILDRQVRTLDLREPGTLTVRPGESAPAGDGKAEPGTAGGGRET